jgi:hypothetical protein
VSSSTYRGFVVCRRFRAGFPATAGFRAAVFFLIAGFLAVVTVAPDDDETRDECLARWRTIFLGAASAIELTVKAATSAISNIFIVLRIIEVPPTGRAVTWFRLR